MHADRRTPRIVAHLERARLHLGLSRVLILLLTLWALPLTLALHSTHYFIDPDWSTLADNGTYNCEDIMRWLGSEKHYSNDKKQIIFGLVRDHSKDCAKDKVLFLDEVSFGRSDKGVGAFNYFRNDKVRCRNRVKRAVAYLSNYSINNNFSHFLHGLVRLFCALIDARWIVWDPESRTFKRQVDYAIWLDEYFKLDKLKLQWLRALGGNIVPLGRALGRGQCITTEKMLYGSGCVKLMPPEKWFGYPGCRAGEVLPAYGQYMRQQFGASPAKDLLLVDRYDLKPEQGLKVAFAVRASGEHTGERSIANLQSTQTLLRYTEHIKTRTENVTFERMDVQSTVQYMAKVHVFVSVHGAGMTNMFFMNPGSAVVEIIPFPLCNCKSRDYFYGVGGYYHGSAVAQNIKHYPYCVEAENMEWHEGKKPKGLDREPGGHVHCSWRLLHAVKSVKLDSTRFVSLMRSIERDLVQSGTIVLTKPIINMSPHANAR